MNFFILEDNRGVSETLSRFLKEEGHQVCVAASWGEVGSLLSDRFDVFIIDFVLPDRQGHQVVEHISVSENLQAQAHFILISGLFDERHVMAKIPENLKKQSVFLKKPIDLKELEKIIQELQLMQDEKTEETFRGRRFSSLLNGGLFNKTCDSHFLIDILLLFNSQKFSGDLIVKSSRENDEAIIEWDNGEIVRVLSDNAPSYFGHLLVEHGFSLKEEIEEILALKEKKYIGQMLIEKGLLSPHILNFILKEQAKIRLSRLISEHHSFKVKIFHKQSEAKDTVTEFGRSEILDWAAECVKTKCGDSWLEEFYLSNRSRLLKPLAPIEEKVQGNRDFLRQYNDFFKSLLKTVSLEALLQKMKIEKRRFLEMVYFGLAARSLRLVTVRPQESSKELQRIYNLADALLSKKSRHLFEVLHLPWKASIEEINKNYKAIVKAIHPDNLPSDCSDQIREKCDKTLKKINEAYNVLSDEQQRREYCEEKERHSFSNTISNYEKGLKLLKSKSYKEALTVLESIKAAPFVPSDISLYILWAEIKANAEQLKTPSLAGEIRHRINRSPLELKISPLFWFVNGLFHTEIDNYEKARHLFKKALQINPDFVEASRELLKANKSQIAAELEKSKKPAFLRKILPFRKSS